jgi:hypothetical protein
MRVPGSLLKPRPHERSIKLRRRFRGVRSARIARFIHHRLGGLHAPVTIGGLILPFFLPSTEPLIKGVEIVFGGALALGFYHSVVVFADRYMPRHSHLAARDLLRPPDYLHQSFSAPYFRIRRVARDSADETRPDADDLEVFVAFSDEEPAIRGAHLELTPDKRYGLYELWWQRNRDSLLMIQRFLPDAKIETIGVSIVLPLTELAAQEFSSGAVETLQLSHYHLLPSEGRTNQLLIDTWILARKLRGSAKRYAHALLLKHVSLFWDPSTEPEVTLYAEPDQRKMAVAMTALGFLKVRASGPFGLFRLRFPKDLYPRPLANELRAMAQVVQTCRSWPI